VTRRQLIRGLTAVGSALLIIVWQGTCSPAAADPTDTPVSATADSAPAVAGMVVYKSSYSVPETVSRVQSQLNSIGKVVTTVDFATTAHWIDKELRPTTLVIGGSPKAGAPIMAANQRAAIDLPQKYLVWQAAGGTVFLGYNSADFVAARAGIDPSNPAVDGLRSGSASVATAVTGNGTPAADGSGGPSGTYLIQKTSNTTVPDSIARYQNAFAMNNLPTVATIDQAAAAAGADTSLPPTEVIITDDATVSVPLVAAQQTIAIDLPLRFVAWQDDSGAVHVAHPDIRVLAARHQVSGQDTLLDRAVASNNYFTNIAAGSGAT
jgi:uncharacterized protein (DUF302 family)